MLKSLTQQLGSQRLIGIDVGSAAVKAVELSREGGQLALKRYALAKTADGNAAAALRQLLKAQGASSARHAVSLASPELIVRPVQFPAMPDKELKGAIRLEAEQAILNGHTVDDMSVDWQPFAQTAADGGLRGLLAVVPKTIIAEKLRALEAAGVRPAIVDVEGLALWNAYWMLLGSREGGAKTVLLANIGAQKTNLVIVKGQDELVLIRDISVGAKAIESGRGNEWAEEVRDSLTYARGKGGLRGLDAAYMTGGGSGPNMLPLVRSALTAPVFFWNPLDQLERSPECPAIEHSVGPLLPIAIGLALRNE